MQLKYEIDYKKIGLRLQKERKRMGCKQEELAQQMGVSAKYISKVENGASKPSLAYIMKFADCSGASLDYLLRGMVLTDDRYSLLSSAEYQDEASFLNIRERYIYDEVSRKLLEVLSKKYI